MRFWGPLISRERVRLAKPDHDMIPLKVFLLHTKQRCRSPYITHARMLAASNSGAYHHSSRPFFFCSVISLSKLDTGSRLKRSSLDGLVAAKSPDCFFIACPTNILPPNNVTICTWATSNVRAARRNQRVYPVYMSTVIGYRFLGQPTYVAKLVTICSPQPRPVQVPILCLGWGLLPIDRNTFSRFGRGRWPFMDPRFRWSLAPGS